MIKVSVTPKGNELLEKNRVEVLSATGERLGDDGVFVTAFNNGSKLKKFLLDELKKSITMDDLLGEDVVENGIVIAKKGDGDKDKIHIKVAHFVSKSIVDWEGVADENGEPIPFSQEVCEQVFIYNSDFMKLVESAQGKVGNYQTANPSQDLPNS